MTMKEIQSMNVKRVLSMLSLVVLAVFASNGAAAQGRFIEAHFGFAQTPSGSGVSLLSDIQSPQSVPSLGISVGWPLAEHSTLGVTYSRDFSNFRRQTFQEQYGLNRLCCELLSNKEILSDVTCTTGFTLGALMASNMVQVGETTDSYNRYGVTVGAKLGVGYKVGNTRFGVMYECYAGGFLSKVYEVPQNLGLPTAGGRGCWGHSLMLTTSTSF